MNRKIAILATNGFEDAELLYPKYRLMEAGYKVELLSLSLDEIKGKYGYPLKPDKTIKEADSEEYLGTIIPGGTKNPDYLRRFKEVLDFVVRINEKKKLIGAICHAGWVLISAKILKGRKATSYFAIKDDMINAGVKFEDAPVVIDENLITSRKPDDLPDFMKEVLKYLESH